MLANGVINHAYITCDNSRVFFTIQIFIDQLNNKKNIEAEFLVQYNQLKINQQK